MSCRLKPSGKVSRLCRVLPPLVRKQVSDVLKKHPVLVRGDFYFIAYVEINQGGTAEVKASRPSGRGALLILRAYKLSSLKAYKLFCL